MILDGKIRDLSHPLSEARLVRVNSIEWKRSVLAAFTRLLFTKAAPLYEAA